MRWGNRTIGGKTLRRALAGLAVLTCMMSPAMAQFLPPGLLNQVPTVSNTPAAIEADLLGYNANTDTITASGNVVMRFQGFVMMGDELVYNRGNNNVSFEGSVIITDPFGLRYNADSLEVTGGMKAAFLRSLTLTLQDGSQISATDVDYKAALETTFTNASYSPCGLCIDSKGRKIGWRVKAAKMTFDAKTHTTRIEQPVLELFGLPVAWLPYLWLPDPETPILQHLRMPTYDYDDKYYGHRIVVPYQVAVNKDTDLIFTPTLMSRQGFLMGVEWQQRHKWGSFMVKASSVFQADKEPFAGTTGDLDWRGALQTSGRFTPVKGWVIGWSYSKFSDYGYLSDYAQPIGTSATDEVYVEHIDKNSWGELRFQQFNVLGHAVGQASQDQQAKALPTGRYDSVYDLPEGWGEFDITTRLIGIDRDADQQATATRVYGYAGRKQHLTLQGAWQNEFILPGGLVATPYFGLRADYANFEGESTLTGDLAPPEDQALTSLTPIAALDLRWPLAIKMGQDVHVIEPIAQLVYRGSDTSLVGITNDNAQSFVFDDTNLFSFDRFSGTDRQETGLRANVGAHYLANFSDGTWIDFLLGQSFQLSGVNAFDQDDQVILGDSTGLSDDASYIVAGLQGSLFKDFSAGGKIQIDPEAGIVTRASLAADYTFDRYAFGLDYRYVAATPDEGVLKDQQEIGATFAVPIDDYWRVTGGGYWDLTANSFLRATGGVIYDDNYLSFGVNGSVGGETYVGGTAKTITATFKLKAPGWFSLGF